MQSIAGNAEHDEKLLSLSVRIDEFEVYSSPHARRIASVADALASHFNLASRDRFYLHQAALIHDIGEMTMNREYIASSRTLSANERLDMQRHPVIGEQEAAKLGLSRGVQLLVRWHHEWWNGGGYPDALENEQIPLAARILRLADTYVALTANRPYRPAQNLEAAKKYIIEWAGIEFDPFIVKTFLALSAAATKAPEPVSQMQPT